VTTRNCESASGETFGSILARYPQCRMNRSGKLYEESRIGVRPSATGMPKSGVPSAVQ
jgi:hypothetical protein